MPNADIVINLKQMKKILIAIIITNLSLCISTTLLAQKSQVSFYYDNAGNRMSREVIYLAPAEEIAGVDSIAYKPAGHETILEALQPGTQNKENALVVFPNPTHGKLNIQFTGDIAGLNTGIAIYNSSGVNIYHNKSASNKHVVDLTGQPAGNYILVVRLQGYEKMEYKIIKQ